MLYLDIHMLMDIYMLFSDIYMLMDIYMLFSDIHMLELCYFQISICSNYAIYRDPYAQIILCRH
jgi:hypothetical protein